MKKNTIEQYFKQRMKALKLSEAKNTHKTYLDGMPYSAQWFAIDKERNAIRINYFNLEGNPITWMKGKKEIEYSRLRYQYPDKNKGKYFQEKGSKVEIYFTPKVIEAYKTKQKIKTLIVVEGEFKAFAISNILGIPAIAIGGIWNFKKKDENNLDQLLIQALEDLEVENVILMHDADARKVTYKENKDLAGRLRTFYGSAERFAEMCKPFNFDLYYYCIQEKYNPESKGIDDLLNSKGIRAKDVADEINNFTTGNHSYFDVVNIRTGIFKLKQYFLLNSESEFYEKYKDIIQDKEFIYNNKSYYFDGNKVISNYQKNAYSYLRIGTDYYKKTWHPIKRIEDPDNPLNNRPPMMILEPWKSGTIKQDFGDSKKFFSLIPKFDKFINLPDNEKYRRIVEIEYEGVKTRYYNIYNPIDHKIEKGNWSTIKMFLTHIFQDINQYGEKVYEFGLDYIKLSYTQPRLRLPVICLVSNEKNTGKTIFLEFLRSIFQQNMSILDNERFTGRFTSHFVNKLFVGVDEGFIPLDKPLMKERIKNFSTGKTQWMEAKGKDAQEIDNYCHLLMTSNQETDFMAMDPDENRFAVLKVKPFEGKTIANLIDKMEKELPAFLYYLLNEYELKYDKYISRFSFPTEAYLTQTFERVAKATRAKWIQEMDEIITEVFRVTDFEELYYATVDLQNELELRRIKVANTTIKSYLQDMLKMESIKKVTRYRMIPLHSLSDYNSEKDVTFFSVYKTGRPYIFKRKDYINDDE